MNLFKKKKEPIKRRKRKKKVDVSMRVNYFQKYALVDSKGKIIEKFRLMQTANQMRYEYGRMWREELKVVELNSNGKIKKKD